MTTTRRWVGLALLLALATLLAGCSATQVGFVALGQKDGHLQIAVVRCEDTELSEAYVAYRVPRTPTDDNPDEYRSVRVGGWRPKDADKPILVLDTNDPSSNWETKKSLEELEDSSGYYVFGEGGNYTNFGGVDFTTSELVALDDGEWLYEADRSESTTARTNDLKALRKSFCRELTDR
jgi:hypothetical protein